MRVLIVPEDFRKDQYIVKPIIEALIEHLGARNAQVRVCQDPLLGGIEQALDWDRIRQLLDRYRGMVDLFLLLVDRDSEPHRRARLDQIESRAKKYLPAKRDFISEHAWQELEVWLIAGIDPLPAGWEWREIRNEREVKETYYIPLARTLNLVNQPGQGRRTLGLKAGTQIRRLLQLCPEDIGALAERVRALL